MSYFFRVIMKYADSTASGLSQNQGRRQPDEHDFDPHLFQPTHPNEDDEGDETNIIATHHIETQDFFDHGIRQPNEGTYVFTFCIISATQQNFGQYSILILLLFAHNQVMSTCHVVCMVRVLIRTMLKKIHII